MVVLHMKECEKLVAILWPHHQAPAIVAVRKRPLAKRNPTMPWVLVPVPLEHFHGIGAATISHRPDPTIVVVMASFVVEAA